MGGGGIESGEEPAKLADLMKHVYITQFLAMILRRMELRRLTFRIIIQRRQLSHSESADLVSDYPLLLLWKWDRAECIN